MASLSHVKTVFGKRQAAEVLESILFTGLVRDPVGETSIRLSAYIRMARQVYLGPDPLLTIAPALAP